MGLKGMTIVIIKLNNTFILSTEIVTKEDGSVSIHQDYH